MSGETLRQRAIAAINEADGPARYDGKFAIEALEDAGLTIAEMRCAAGRATDRTHVGLCCPAAARRAAREAAAAGLAAARAARDS